MDLGELLLKKHIDENMIKFIKNHVNNFEKLDIVRFFGLNPSSRVDIDTLKDVINTNEKTLISSVEELYKDHILEEFKVEGKKLYELSKDKDTLEYVKRFISYYDKMSIRLLIIGYLLNKSIEEKK